MYPNHPVFYPTAPYLVGSYPIAPQDLQRILDTTSSTLTSNTQQQAHADPAEMSGSTLSCPANRPSVAEAAVTASAATGGPELTSLGDVSVDTPSSASSHHHTDPPTPAQLVQLSSSSQTSQSFVAEAFGSDGKGCSSKIDGNPMFAESAAEAGAISPDHTPVDPSATATATACNAPTSVANNSVGIESSLLLKPFSGMAGNNTTKPANASMATPQSLQDSGSASISPLEMLIAALDPQKQQQQQQQQQQDSVVAFPNADYVSMPWGSPNETATTACLQNVARRASDAVMFEGYQIGKPLSSNGSNGSDMVAQAEQPLGRTMLRKGSYPQPGAKRPFSDFEHLLSAADMYANNQIGAVGGTGSAFSQAGGADGTGVPAAKHARHDSLIDSSCSMGNAAAEPNGGAASFSYAPTAFPYSTRRSTVLGNYFDPLGSAANQPTGMQGNSAAGGIPLMSEPVTSVNGQAAAYFGRNGNPYNQQQHYRSLSLSHIDYPNMHGMMGGPPGTGHHPQHMSAMTMPQIPASLQMASPLAPAPPFVSSSAVGFGGSNPAMGYFYDGMAIDGGPISSSSNGMADGMSEATPGSIIFASAPIPSIPGVTVSPKEQPRRLSEPDLTPTEEGERSGPKARPRRQKVRFSDDMYTPMWVRNNGQQKEGFCDTCAAGKWLQLKNSAFWYHKQFFHGISSVSGRPFVRPLQVRHYDADIIEGLCHQCHQWVPIANSKRRNSVLWFRHAHKCHVYHKPKKDDSHDCKG